jgi:hypothetical protein
MRTLSLFAAIVLVSVCVPMHRTRAQAQSPSQGAKGAALADHALPHDSHDGLTVSVDPYTDTARAKEKFGKANPVPVGILPVEVFLRNDNASAIRIDLETIQLTIHPAAGSDQNINWLSPRDVARAVAYPRGPKDTALPRFPIGVPSGADKKVDALADILRPFVLDSDIVPPKAAVHGFLFFDMSRDMKLVSNSSLYLPDASMIPANTLLMFFEVPLAAGAGP